MRFKEIIDLFCTHPAPPNRKFASELHQKRLRKAGRHRAPSDEVPTAGIIWDIINCRGYATTECGLHSLQSSDVVISINQTAEELENKRMRLCVLKNRDYYRGLEIELYNDLDMMLLCDLIYAQHNGWL